MIHGRSKRHCACGLTSSKRQSPARKGKRVEMGRGDMTGELVGRGDAVGSVGPCTSRHVTKAHVHAMLTRGTVHAKTCQHVNGMASTDTRA